MLKGFLQKFIISLAIVAVGFNGLCFKFLSGQNIQIVPMAKAMAIVSDQNQNCDGEKSMQMNVNCCFTSHSAETTSVISGQTNQNFKKIAFTPSFPLSHPFDFLNYRKEQEKLYPRLQKEYRPPTLTGILIKKE